MISAQASSLSSLEHLKGYLNLSNAGFSGLIPSHIGNLSSLKVLDVSKTYPPFIVDDMAWISGLSSLEHLNLDNVDLSGAQEVDRLLYIIPSLLKLSLSSCSLSNAHNSPRLNSSIKNANIKHLDLSSNNFRGQIPKFLQNITYLEFLDLSGSNLSLVWNFASMLNMIPSVSELHLSQCELQKINISPTHHNFSRRSNIKHLDLSSNEIKGMFPSFFTNMTSLLSLDLSGNDLNSTVPVMPNLLKLDLSFNMFKHVGIWRQCHIKELIVSYNRLQEEMVGSTTNVSECSQYDFERLYLSGNYLNGSLSESLGRLTNLRDLDLSGNNLAGPVPEALGKLRLLQSLDLSRNHLIGSIPDFLGKPSKLYLAHNQFNDSIPESLGSLTGLKELLLQSNQLTGPIPASLARLVSLQRLSMSSYLLNGTIPTSFRQLFRLNYLDVSNNSLIGIVSEAHFANLSALKYLNTAYNNKLTFSISQWFRTQRNLEELVLSNASIFGPLPTWLQKMPIIHVLDLSHNKLTGSLTNLPSGDPLKHISYDHGGLMLVQNNLFTGSIPKSLCTRIDLEVLDLSGNKLSGKIPKCPGNLEHLKEMLLSSNRLSGLIPSSLGRISPSSLGWLQLNDNNFNGELPRKLMNLSSLFVLDLGENKMSGNIPEWIGENLRMLIVLRLRSIPHCFGELQSMFTTTRFYPVFSYNNENVMQVIKGVALEYKTTWMLVVNIDLSSNKLVGEIPHELTTLNVLMGLNLSHNHLSGVIPKDIGNMKSLFSLDFSTNELTGIIPPSISALNFLSHLNLSRNYLSGQIPTGKQLQTLTDPSIYAGNRDLCGAPLTKKCANHEDTMDTTDKRKYQDGHKRKKVWFYLDIMYGFATGFWGIIGVLMFKKQWRHKLFMFSEETINIIHVAVAVRNSKMKRGRIGARVR
uniref:LRR receptor-like serine/threonine-protein kinase GSO1 n=1 Tax=Tanacetum cinerariifolium TaxID=118510 RepID=A0A699I710_TANCI|nr:LRR receptor-like serine/threonine-protein kinase GSO1 [Tanacetum cinerariifolium]